MTALIVDDERLARRELRLLLEAHPEIEIVGEAADVSAALEAIAQTRPEVLFLDIHMPDGSGFELAARLPAPAPRIIFTTAHDQHAVRAFEVNAIDYLLKPIAAQRLADALARLTNPAPPSAAPPPLDHSAPRLRSDERVLLRSDDRVWFIPVASIRLLESEGNYTRVLFEQQRPLIHRGLAALEARLPPELFLRANRAQIVNLQAIADLQPWFSGSLKAKLVSGEEVEFSRRQAQLFREWRGI